MIVRLRIVPVPDLVKFSQIIQQRHGEIGMICTQGFSLVASERLKNDSASSVSTVLGINRSQIVQRSRYIGVIKTSTFSCIVNARLYKGSASA